MAIGCGPKIAKMLLIIFNLLFWLSGLILIIIGAVYLANGTLKYIDDVINSSTNRNILIGFIIVGSVIFIIGFCGCCGAIKESRLLLSFYIILLLVIIVAEMAFGIYAIVKRQPVEKLITDNFENFVNKIYNDTDPTIKSVVDNTQQTLQCCGVNNYTDWKNSNWYKNASKSFYELPLSCCTPVNVFCGTPKSNASVFREGCISKMLLYVNNSFPVVIGVALGIAFFEIFVCICAFCLCRNTDSHGHTI